MHSVFSAMRRVSGPVCLIFFVGMHLSAAQQKQATTPSGSPLQLRLCLDNTCSTLTWRGDHYDGVNDKSSDVLVHYTVEQWSSAGVHLHGRTTFPVSTSRQAMGPIPIVMRTYAEGDFIGTIAPDGHSLQNALDKWQVGKLHGEKIFQLTWEADASTPDASQACSDTAGSPPLPSALEVCDGTCITASDRSLATWIFQGRKGTGSWSGGQRATLQITRWEAGNIEILREDTPTSTTPGATIVYQGLFCGSAARGTAIVNWPGHVKDLKAFWTATVPMTTCAAVEDDALRLDDVAHEALRFRRLPDAFKCLSRAADLGDMEARTATGLMYRDGIGTKIDYTEAKARFTQSAIQGDYNAEVALSQMYEMGLGVPADEKQAKQWQQRAFNNPIKVAERQRADQRATQEQFAFLGLSALVEAMARPSVIVY